MGTSTVTGATGFIGSRLVERLATNGEQVRCLVRKMSSKTRRLEELGVKMVQGDLTSTDAIRLALKGCDTVYHAAGANFAITPEALLEVNEGGTRRLAAAAAAMPNPPRFLHVSSAAASGPTTRDHRRREYEPPHPISSYGRSKLAGEVALREFASELPATIVRPGVVFGPENQEVFPVYRLLRNTGIHPRAGLLTPPVSMIHVDDLLDLMLRAVADGERLAPQANDAMNLGEGIYNASDEVCPDWRELGNMIAKSVGRKYVIHCPLFVPVVGIGAAFSQLWQAITGRPNVFNLDKIREASAPSWAISNQKAFASLQFQPGAPLQQRLDETAQWYLDNGWLK